MYSENISTHLNELALIKMASRGDLDAFNQLVLMYQNMTYHHAYALLGDPTLAEDITQESFIKAFQNIGGFRDGSFRGWLLRIVTNSAYDLLRRSRRYPIQPLFPVDEDGEEIESAVWLSDPKALVQETVEQNEFSKDLYKALNELPDSYRNVLILIDVHDFHYTEAANSLKIPLGTVKSRLARARLQMKEKLRGNLKHGKLSVHTNPCIAI
jgi:RNA polymerase sigma-70 factor (ECF subfamily)